MKYDRPSDEEEVIRQCLDGSEDAFAVLVDRYKAMVYNLAHRMLGDADTANDVAQESFIAAYEGLGKFRFGSKFSTWLYRIALNKCRDHLRAARDTVPADDISGTRSDPGPSPEKAVSALQDSDLLQRALDALPAEYREVIILKHIQELDYAEIAAVTGAGITALKVRAHRGREMLRKLLEEAGVTHE